MIRNFLLFAGIISLLLFSCHKSTPDNNGNPNPNDTTQNNNNPDPPAHNWFKLKTILSTTVYASISDVYKDSTDIALDSVNRKIVMKDYSSGPYSKDTFSDTYSYNSNYQLTKIEHVSSYNGFSISYMEFNRDASGQVTNVLSGYKNGLLAFTTGSVTYNKHGDTTFITYLDSAKKNPSYYDGQDFHTVALLNGKLIADTEYPIVNKSADTSLYKYVYDATGNLITYSETYNKAAPRITTFQRGGQASPDLQKFFTQWMGDLFWFYRSKSFFPLQLIVYNNYILGNPVQSITDYYGNVLPFTNTFDAGSGNLTSLSYVGPPVGSSGKSTTTTTFRYRP